MERVWFAHRAVSAFHTGATATDMEHYLIPMIQKKPSNIILHVGKNDAMNLQSRTVLNNLLKLKALVKYFLPTVEFSYQLQHYALMMLKQK